MAAGPVVSVLMPTFQQAHFISRAIHSLLRQSFDAWQLVIVDDGSVDSTEEVVQRYVADRRIFYTQLKSNTGLGAALNHALDLVAAPLIAYLPSDDVYFESHLSTLVEQLAKDGDAALAYSGVRHELRVPGKGVLRAGTSIGQIVGYPLQLVQVMHRRTNDRWLEREELVTDDLDLMYWSKLRSHGQFVPTGQITCEWVDHPGQLHKVVREPLGGINPYRSRYNVKHPLRFHTTVGNHIDEVEHYRRFRERPDTPPSKDALKILLVGELAFNPERVLALEERGHRLYGLWTSDGHWFNTVGPMPFGHVQDLPKENWPKAVRRLKPDVIYALLNWEAVPFAHQVLTANPEVPFVWHFKEGPFDCIANGTWAKLLDLYTRSDGQIYCSREMRMWFESVDPGIVSEGRWLVMDGDLPKRDWFTDDRSPRLSDVDGEIHTVVPGGPIGLDPPVIGALAQHGIHVHFYGDFHRGQWPSWVEEVKKVAPRHLHLHPQVDHESWVSELSRYDAGWLHLVKSKNQGDITLADWHDLNYAARIPTLVSAGVPLLQYDGGGAVVAMESLARELDLGLFFTEVEELAEQLEHQDTMDGLRESVWSKREQFTFDYYADRLIAFFREVIEGV